MKFQFEQLEYQEDAIKSIVDIFNGQEVYQSRFTVTAANSTKKGAQTSAFDDLGYGNKLRLTDNELYRNIKAIQQQNKLAISDSEEASKKQFCVEMETGTGKTYVYLRTIMELHEKHNFTKFIIVVPSVAIREGVNKSIENTRTQIKKDFNNVIYESFVYDSKDVTRIQNFARSQNIEIMVINIQAFNADDNIINIKRDSTSVAPIELIAATNPIIIVDEPQSTTNTAIAKAAIAKLKPLAIFNYSATFREDDKPNMMYRLNAADAYDQKLVKQIEVASVVPKNFYNEPYVRMTDFKATATKVTAKVELHAIINNNIVPKVFALKHNDDLRSLTNNDVYRDNFIVSEIGNSANPFVQFMNGQFVTQEEPISNFPIDEVRRLQIRQTIKEHLDKEKKLNPQGIKVLSLFFIDKVSNYRTYDAEGNPIAGEYAAIFEEEYSKLIKSPVYRDLWENEIIDLDVPVSAVHDGYFSIDKKSKASNKKDKYEMYVDTSGKVKKDYDTYHAIMVAKEDLISLTGPLANLRFIFSHSALKEGWDNPNVFQICTLKEAGSSEIRRRQEIGRGLRIARNQKGERVPGFETNLLTVMASESYQQFVDNLQHEMATEGGMKFDLVPDQFAVISFLDEKGERQSISKKQSQKLFGHLLKEEYINKRGKILDKLKLDLKNKTVTLPYEFQPEEIKSQVYDILIEKAGNLNVKDRDKRKPIKVNKEVLLDPEFIELWDRIKYQTRYSVQFDSEELIQKCIDQIDKKLFVSGGELIFEKTKVAVTEGGLQTGEIKTQMYRPQHETTFIPDIIGYLQNEVSLTRKALLRIIRESKKVDMIKRNPQFFIKHCADIIKDVMKTFLVDGIKYEKIGENAYWKMELFEALDEVELFEDRLIETTKSPTDYIQWDSGTESQLIKDFENSDNIKLYAKLPTTFKIDTPLGNYSPDWAVLWEENGEKKLYFVLESKSTQLDSELRGVEKGKIACAIEHFKELDKLDAFHQITSLEDFQEKI